ncbi:MAG: hypothetical protein ACI965_002179 [Paraglaciecola sp.]|jgi:hypothetical protein
MSVNNNKRKVNMLKAYAVALVLVTATPIAVKSVDGAQAPEATKTPTTQIQVRKGSVRF